MKTIAKIIGFLGFWYCVGAVLGAILGPTLAVVAVLFILWND